MAAKTTEVRNAVRKSSTNRAARSGKRPALPRSPRSMTANSASFAESTLALQQELDTVRREHARLQQAIYEAAQIQRRLCAPRELAWGDFEIAGESFAVRHLTGDFFKVIELDSTLALVLGDIAGKGLTAGIWQTHMMDLIQRAARNHPQPCDAVAAVNRELCQDLGEPPITALFFARLEPATNELVYCNAGLPAPLIFRSDKSVESLEEGGPMLGALEQASYASGRVQLNPGDMLLAYSDGLTECRNHLDDEFETARLSAAANAVSGADASQVLFSTLAAVLDFAGSGTPADDLTLLVVRRCEAVPTRNKAKGSNRVSMTRRAIDAVDSWPVAN